MPLNPPAIEFYKGEQGAGWGGMATLPPSVDISHKVVPVNNWMNRSVQVTGESSLWNPAKVATIPLFSTVDSGVGFIPDSMAPTAPEILQDAKSADVNIFVVNNINHVAPNPGAGTGYATAENCTLRIYDDVGVITQNKEPLQDAAPANHFYWFEVQQVQYYRWGGAAWVADAPQKTAGAPYNEPYCLGKGDRYPGGLAGAAPLPCPAPGPNIWTLNGSPKGVGKYQVGSNTFSFVGCGEGQDPLMNANGGIVDLQLRVLVPAGATPSAHLLGLAIEYTFVVS